MRTTTDNLGLEGGENGDGVLLEDSTTRSNSPLPEPEVKPVSLTGTPVINKRMPSQNEGSNNLQTPTSDHIALSSCDISKDTSICHPELIDVNTEQSSPSPLTDKYNPENTTAMANMTDTLYNSSCNLSSIPTSHSQTQRLCTIEIEVDGMTCESCSRSIETTMADKRGVTCITVSLVSKLATVTYDSTLTTAGEVAAGIEDMGFGVTLPANSPIEDTEAHNSMDLYVFDVSGMTCDSCARTIQDTLLDVDGIGDVSVSLAYNTATVRFDRHKMSSASVIDAIEDMGFRASISKDNEGQAADDTRREDSGVKTSTTKQPGKKLSFVNHVKLRNRATQQVTTNSHNTQKKHGSTH